METFWRTPADTSFGPFGGIWADESSDWKASLQVDMPDPRGLFLGSGILLCKESYGLKNLVEPIDQRLQGHNSTNTQKHPWHEAQSVRGVMTQGIELSGRSKKNFLVGD